MRSKYLLAGTLVALATPALAQDAGSTGLRAEVRAGYDNAQLNVDYDDGVDSFDESDGSDGVAYGAEIGFDFNLGGVVAGPYAGIDFANTDYCSELFGEDEACIEAGRNITAGVRIGAQVSPNALLYAKGGYSNGRVTLGYEDFQDIIDDFEESENLDGFHIGAGAEVGFSGSTYGKLEYVYTQYNGYDYEDTDFAAGADLSRHQVLVGFGVRF